MLVNNCAQNLHLRSVLNSVSVLGRKHVLELIPTVMFQIFLIKIKKGQIRQNKFDSNNVIKRKFGSAVWVNEGTVYYNVYG